MLDRYCERGRQGERERERQTDRQTDRETDRQTDTERKRCPCGMAVFFFFNFLKLINRKRNKDLKNFRFFKIKPEL